MLEIKGEGTDVPAMVSNAAPSGSNAQRICGARLPSQNWRRLDGGATAGGSGQGALLVSVGGRRISQIQVEAREKESQGFATIYKLDDFKGRKADFPTNMQIFPLAMIHHKSRK